MSRKDDPDCCETWRLSYYYRLPGYFTLLATLYTVFSTEAVEPVAICALFSAPVLFGYEFWSDCLHYLERYSWVTLGQVLAGAKFAIGTQNFSLLLVIALGFFYDYLLRNSPDEEVRETSFTGQYAYLAALILSQPINMQLREAIKDVKQLSILTGVSVSRLEKMDVFVKPGENGEPDGLYRPGIDLCGNYGMGMRVITGAMLGLALGMFLALGYTIGICPLLGRDENGFERSCDGVLGNPILLVFSAVFGALMAFVLFPVTPPEYIGPVRRDDDDDDGDGDGDGDGGNPAPTGFLSPNMESHRRSSRNSRNSRNSHRLSNDGRRLSDNRSQGSRRSNKGEERASSKSPARRPVRKRRSSKKKKSKKRGSSIQDPIPL